MAGDTNTKRTVAILAFHKIGEPSPGGWETWYYTSALEFIAYLNYLRDHAWEVIDAAALMRGLSDPEGLPHRAAVVTFDDGYRSVLTVAAPLLVQFGYPAVVFVPTEYVGQGSHSFDANSREPDEPLCTWAELRSLERYGVAVQSHGVSHRAFSELTRTQQVAEVRESKAILESQLQKPVELFAFPYGDGGNNPQELGETLERVGYQAACVYDGLLMQLPVADRYRLSRLTLGRWADPQTVFESAADKANEPKTSRTGNEGLVDQTGIAPAS